MPGRQSIASPRQKPGFFHWDKKSYQVDVLRSPDEYTGQTAILIWDVASKAEERAWLAALPQMRALREIHFPSSPLLEAVAQLPDLEHLNLEISRIKSLALLAGHKAMRSLNLLLSKSLADPEVIGGWPNMECLALENVAALHDISWVAQLQQLKHLSLDGGMFVKQPLASLEPLRQVQSLQWLSLISTKVDDADSLFVLAELPNLKRLDTAYYWPKGHLTKLSEMRPDLLINDDRHPNVEEVRKR